MAEPNKAEKIAERKLVITFADNVGARIIKLQDLKKKDDGKEDGVIDYKGKILPVEVRRKGYENHHGKICYFDKGWKTDCLTKDGGIYLNKSTVKRYIKSGFIYVVDIKGCPIRYCYMSPAQVKWLLQQPSTEVRSTNDGKKQLAQSVPLEWFKQTKKPFFVKY